ncbi:type II toxin-antitoxin system MqsR family toxin [Roseateles chitinivorans]|uniref:type II toxin-antitoxin system MqsR family toxin n=1 Tax=Roseateles chitinivorans TaxID=2917965 RepID=UPI003D66DA4F
MEKHKAHYSLSTVKQLTSEGRIRATLSASLGAEALGFDHEQMSGVVLALGQGDFYKSMTTYHDHRAWQDVYRPTTNRGRVYLKLSVVEEVVLISFKEL